ncbi:hypothetical protein [Butyrivibrio sp. JL13D10]|uniref:hypothetical protein n=1 Tax=Butyrivibrio sp. JL13D10 TaxID=3236815 RepID=UPI0038B5C32C
MYRTRQYRITKNNTLYSYCQNICRASAVLYNSANFIIRQYASATEGFERPKEMAETSHFFGKRVSDLHHVYTF